LARIYAREKRHDEAIALAQALQARFPHNGYYRLLSGRSQCALGRYQACAETLQALSEQLAADPSRLVQRDDRFDLYYRLGTALNELGRYDQAFTALRQAINQDPRAEKDETLWAKYHVARLYERRGHLKTARQMYQTLRRGRYIDALHRQVERRLADLPASR
jgi:tetratricopeptide (TPR) repeat protein